MVDSGADSCLFCRVAHGDVPATVVYENDAVVAFRDINPQAPTHVLVIPREHHENAGALAAADPALLAALVEAAAEVATLERITDYRLVFNTGPQAGQSVFHVHGHVLGGRSLQWPPG